MKFNYCAYKFITETPVIDDNSSENGSPIFQTLNLRRVVRRVKTHPFMKGRRRSAEGNPYEKFKPCIYFWKISQRTLKVNKKSVYFRNGMRKLTLHMWKCCSAWKHMASRILSLIYRTSFKPLTSELSELSTTCIPIYKQANGLNERNLYI